MIQIKIIRHSERLDYSNPLYWLFCIGQYWADSPLTQFGHSIANTKGRKMACEKFKPKHIYTSPYNRTIATATEIKKSFPNSEILIEPLLAEYQPTYAHHISLHPDGIPTTYQGKNTEFNYPETHQHFEARIKFIISKLIEKNDQDIIIVTHGEVLRAYIDYIQLLYPESFLDASNIPYLTTLTFYYDKINNRIDPKNISIDINY